MDIKEQPDIRPLLLILHNMDISKKLQLESGLYYIISQKLAGLNFKTVLNIVMISVLYIAQYKYRKSRTKSDIAHLC